MGAIAVVSLLAFFAAAAVTSGLGLADHLFRWMIYILGSLSVAAVLWARERVHGWNNKVVSIAVSVACIGVLAFLLVAAGASGVQPREVAIFLGIAGLALALGGLVGRDLFTASWTATLAFVTLLLLAILGWMTFRTAQGFRVDLFSSLGACLGAICWAIVFPRALRSSNARVPAVFFLVPFIISAGTLAGRSTMFDSYVGPYHWEYFAGAIRTLNGGGLLLWDTPSQYGFLNILVAHWLPLRSSWDQFFAFQALLLFVTGVFAFFLVTDGKKKVSWGEGFFAFAFLLSLFFADPGLIGPQPFPSSSVVRFFPVYLMFFLIMATGERSSRWLRVLSPILWGVSSFWSAECANYLIAINVGYLFWLVCARRDYRMAFRHLGIAILSAVVFAGGVALVYQIRFGIQPDFGMIYLYATRYAEGFGSFPMAPINGGLLVLAFVYAMTSLPFGSSGESKAVYVGTFMILGLTSYFIGRAVSDNIVAISPFFILTIGTIAPRVSLETRKRSFAWKGVCLVGLLLTLPTIASQQWSGVLREIEVFGMPVAEKVPPLSPSYEEALTKMGRPDLARTQFYGDTVAIPRMKDQGRASGDLPTCLPTPLQLLEEPIPEAVRAQIIERYLARVEYRDPCWLIVDGNHAPERLVSWLRLLEKFFVIENLSGNPVGTKTGHILRLSRK